MFSLRFSFSRLVLMAVALLPLGVAGAVGARECFVYAGTYTNWEELGPNRHNPPGEVSKGIYVFRFDLDSGKLTPLGLAAESRNPTYLTFAPSSRVLYATNELYSFHGEASGAVSAFAIDAATGRLTLLKQLAARGTGTCHASVDRSGRVLLAANFGSGSVAVFSLAPDGALRAMTAFEQDTGTGPNPRQAGPHAHAFNLTPDGRFAIASEFGSDRLRVYRLDVAEGKLAPADPPVMTLKAGSAPRHLAFRPTGDVAYSVNEIDSTLTVLAYNAARGTLRGLQTVSTLPTDFTGRNTAAEVVVHPNGKFLYVSNRGHHSIAVFTIAADGRVSLVTHVPCGGRTPRGFHVDADGRWLITANQDTHNLAVFAIDPRTGVPTPTGQTEEVRSPVCVKFLNSAR
jgi:6-phosphogluconolactonase